MRVLLFMVCGFALIVWDLTANHGVLFRALASTATAFLHQLGLA